MNVLYISHNFPPISHSGTFRSESFVRYLPEFGIRPLVISSREPLRAVRRYSSDQIARSNEASKCTLKYVDWGDRYNSTASLLGLARHFYKFPIINSGIKNWFRSKALKRAACEVVSICQIEEFAAIYASSPPCESLLLAEHLSNLTGIPFVCDLRDPWTYNVGAKYRSYVDFLVERRSEKRVLDAATHIIANTDAARSQIIEKININPDKITVIPNGYDEDKFLFDSDGKSFDRGSFNIVYTGLMSSSKQKKKASRRDALKKILMLDYIPVQADYNTRSPKYFLEGLGLLLDGNPGLANIIRCHFVGSFDSDLITELEGFRYSSCIRIHDPTDQAAANKLCTDANLLLLLQVSMICEGKAYCTAVPSKLFNYIRSGTWILAPMANNDAASIIQRHRAGTVVPPCDVKAIAREIERQVKEWMENGKKATSADVADFRYFDRHSLTGMLAVVLRETAASSTVSTP